MQMKKSLFGFTAKVAMAVLAVCSFVLTSCYEKTPIAMTPSEYYVVGTVYAYDAETEGYTVLSGASVTLDGKAVSNPFNEKLGGYASEVTVMATAEGYKPGKITKKITKLADYNQTSVTSVDLVLVPADYVFEVGTPVVVADMTAEEVAAAFEIEEGEISVTDEGKVQVHTHYCLDSDLHANLHMNFHANHANGVTNNPYLATAYHYIGYISADVEDAELRNATTAALNTKYVGTVYADFAANTNNVEVSVLLNANSEMSLAGYCVCRDFTVWAVPFNVDGTEVEVLALQSDATTIQPIAGDSHDNHNNHDNHVHANHSGATAWGGGAGDAE